MKLMITYQKNDRIDIIYRENKNNEGFLEVVMMALLEKKITGNDLIQVTRID